MKAWKKIAIGAGIVVLLAIIVGFTVHQSSKNVVTVQTGKAQRQDLATVVSATKHRTGGPGARASGL